MSNHTRNFQRKVLKINGLNSKLGSQLISLRLKNKKVVVSSAGVADAREH